jgi:diaminohydroxyphosphoribosylaminopyrimidine deaminase/5-amino-6-(5-phosphoribosylamino)uracil reductase
MNAHDIRFMQRALELARKGIGLASPNPTVGCVVVHDGHIVGEGFHQYDRKDHAEVAALKSAGEKARGATVYATLEPCNHRGRTGPCTEALIAAGVARVVVALRDPNPKVQGGGIERLNAARIATDFADADQMLVAEELNESFFRWISSGKPFLTLKSALTLDGQLALPKSPKTRSREWITSEESRAEVHRLRHASDALITGIGTILADNPLLSDRSGLPRRRRLLRVILDSRLRLPLKSRVAASSDGDLIIFTCCSLRAPRAHRLRDLGIELVRIPAKRGLLDVHSVLSELGRRELLSALLECGPSLNASALLAGAVDKLFLFYAPKLAGAATVPFVRGKVSLPRFRSHRLRQQEFGPDFAVEAWLREPFRG